MSFVAQVHRDHLGVYLAVTRGGLPDYAITLQGLDEAQAIIWALVAYYGEEAIPDAIDQADIARARDKVLSERSTPARRRREG